MNKVECTRAENEALIFGWQRMKISDIQLGVEPTIPLSTVGYSNL